MLFDTEQAVAEEPSAKSETAIGTGFLFDWEHSCYFMEAGSPVEVTGTEGVKEWVRQVLRTRRGRYAIYPGDFGAPAQDLVGQKAPKGFDLSELRRQLAESAAYNPAIREIGTMAYDGKTITCTITLGTDSGGTQEVIGIEP